MSQWVSLCVCVSLKSDTTQCWLTDGDLSKPDTPEDPMIIDDSITHSFLVFLQITLLKPLLYGSWNKKKKKNQCFFQGTQLLLIQSWKSWTRFGYGWLELPMVWQRSWSTLAHTGKHGKPTDLLRIFSNKNSLEFKKSLWDCHVNGINTDLLHGFCLTLEDSKEPMDHWTIRQIERFILWIPSVFRFLLLVVVVVAVVAVVVVVVVVVCCLSCCCLAVWLFPALSSKNHGLNFLCVRAVPEMHGKSFQRMVASHRSGLCLGTLDFLVLPENAWRSKKMMVPRVAAWNGTNIHTTTK